MIDAIRRCMLRDLDGMLAELDGYPDDASVWALPDGIANSTGTLALHLAGNLRHFVGGQLGGTGYVRDREAEFAERGLSRDELRTALRTARDDVDTTLRQLDPARLAEPFPIPLGKTTLGTALALIHLATHLAYHLGQADIHRRVVTGTRAPVGAMGVKPLTEV